MRRARLCATLALAAGWVLGCGAETIGPGLVSPDGRAVGKDLPLVPDARPLPRRDGGSVLGPDRGPSGELCNQLDDDHDGQVDESCPCDPAINAGQQDCYTGPVATRGQGICRVGRQRCLGDQEFTAWGSCIGEATPQTEISRDGLDNDCDGEIDEDNTPPPPTCSNGATNYPTCTVNAGGQCLNGNVNPPACTTAPTCGNGATNYPTCTVDAAGQCLNGNVNPPACTTAPTCGNGATNYPTCTVDAAGQCLNGNVNPPACTTAPTCGNGATNYPMCTVNAAGQCLNGNVNPPACTTTPTCGNGATNYPTCTVNAAGQCVNGNVNPPACTTAPTCGNGATNYPTCTVNAAGQCLNGNVNPPACTTAPTCGNGATNYPMCTVNAAGRCLNGRVNPPACTTAPVFALDVTSANLGHVSANSVFVGDPTLSSSPVGVTTDFSVTIKNTGNTTCTPSSSEVWSQYVGGNAGVMDCTFSFQGGAHVQPLSPGQSRALGVRAFAKNSVGANYTFNASNGLLMGGLRLRCEEDVSRSIVFGIGLVNAVVMSPGTCANGAVNAPTCTVNAAGQCLNGNVNPPACTTPANRAPGVPSMDAPTSVVAGVPFSPAFTATDPDGDTLRYGLDATADGTVDTWYPATSYVNSGTPQRPSWRLSAGTFTFQVLAEDSRGARSGWTRHTIVVSDRRFKLEVTSPIAGHLTENSVAVRDPLLRSSVQGTSTSFTITVKNSGNTTCTPSTSEVWSQYVGTNATVVDCRFDFQGSAHLQALQPGESRALGVTAFARNSPGANYVFNASNNGFMGGLRLRCAENTSQADVLSIGLLNAVAMSR